MTYYENHDNDLIEGSYILPRHFNTSMEDIIELDDSDVIDLTEDSYALAAHRNINTEEVIELDGSIINVNHRPTSKNESATIKKPPTPKKTELKSPAKVEKRKEKKRESIGIGNCAICWDKLGTNPMASTKCGHVYCMKCLEQCLKRERKCPTCRCVLKGRSAYHPIYLSH